MKTFVINLAKNVERMRLVDERLRALSIDYERVEAVYGREVPAEERRRNSSRFWWWCIIGSPMRVGEYGCAMSHLSIYKRMMDEQLDIACVLEDDVKARECLPQLIRYLASVMDVGKPQVALISNNRDKDVGGEFRLQAVRTGTCTDGYVITLPAARKIYEKNFPVKCPSDSWTLWRRKGWLELYQAYPEGANQEWQTTDGYASDVTAAGDVIVDIRKMSGLGRVLWKIKRLVGISICKILIW